MKKQKIIMVLIAISTGLSMLYASEQNKNKTQSANMMVEKLNTDVILTDSQKTVLLQAAVLFFEKRNAASQKNGDEIIQEKKNAEIYYNAVLDSILMPEQKTILKEKNAEKLQETLNHK